MTVNSSDRRRLPKDPGIGHEAKRSIPVAHEQRAQAVSSGSETSLQDLPEGFLSQGLVHSPKSPASPVEKDPIEYYFRNEKMTSARISLVLLDWTCRESFHLLDYLQRQTVGREDFEIILIENYSRRCPDVQERLDRALKNGTHPPLDQWIALNVPENVYYHKHLMYNVGIAAARGSIVSLMDSDAIVSETFIESILDHFDRHPDSVLHLDQVRNVREEFCPFNYPSIEELLADGCVNWAGDKTTGLCEGSTRIVDRNYGACMCSRRDALIEIGGADEHDSYLGHVCGPYDLTFRLINSGRPEHWLEDEFLYHPWHPGSDGEANYFGPHDGYNNSVLALENLNNKTVYPRVENPLIRKLRQSGLQRPVPRADLEEAIDAHRLGAWVLDGHKKGIAKARTAMNAGQWSQALESILQAGGVDQDPWSLAELGWTLRHMGRKVEAVACFERAAMCNPAYHRIYTGLGWSLLETGRFTEAIGAFERAEALLYPRMWAYEAEIVRGLAHCWLHLEEKSKVLACTRRLKELAARDMPVLAEAAGELESRAQRLVPPAPMVAPKGAERPRGGKWGRTLRKLRISWRQEGFLWTFRKVTARLADRARGFDQVKRMLGIQAEQSCLKPPSVLNREPYFIQPPEFQFQEDLDLLVLELPPRYQPMLPNGLGYLDSLLSQSNLKYQIADVSIAMYHRYHARRLGPDGGPMSLPPGFARNEDPWDNTFIHRWHEEEVADFFWDYMHDVIEKIMSAKPRVIGLSLNGGNRSLARRMVREVRSRLPETKVFVGGYDCVYDQTGRFLFTNYDYMFIKEAELTLVPVLRAVLRGETPRDIPGVLSRFDTPGRPWTEPQLLQQLDACPWPRYDWTRLDLYQNFQREHLIPISGSRGCAWGRCRFCAECFQYRGRSPERIVEEIGHFVARGFHTFHFNESDVNGDPQALYDVCSGIIRNNWDVQLVGQLRIDRRNTAEYFRHLAKAGFTHLRFGVDGWSQHTLKLQSKGYAISRVKQNIRDCHAAGIRTTVNIVLGVPGETEEDIDKMIENLTELKDDIDQVEGINTLILAAGSDYFIHSDLHKITFRGQKEEIFRKHPHYIPTELWYSEDPYIDQQVRLERMERLCTALFQNGVNIGPFASMVVENLRKIGADPNVKVSSTMESED